MVPQPYYPFSRYTDRTPVFVPPLVQFIRAGAVAMLEWMTLKYSEHSPFWVDVCTVVIAIMILAVLQSRDWLNIKGRYYFSISFSFLVLGWLLLVTLGFLWQNNYFGKTSSEVIGTQQSQPQLLPKNYLSDFVLAVLPGPQLQLKAKIDVTVDYLRVYVDYASIASTTGRVRAKVGKIDNSMKGEIITLDLLSQGSTTGTFGDKTLWWGPEKDNHILPGLVTFGTNVPHMLIFARIVIVGNEGREQHYYFRLLRINAAQYGDTFIVLDAETDLWARVWENSG